MASTAYSLQLSYRNESDENLLVPNNDNLVPARGLAALEGPDGDAKTQVLADLETFACAVAARSRLAPDLAVRVVVYGPDAAGDPTVGLADVTVARSTAP